MTAPWPWWVEHYQRALRFHKAPWDLVRGPNAMRFFIQCDVLYQNALHRHERWQREQREPQD